MRRRQLGPPRAVALALALALALACSRSGEAPKPPAATPVPPASAAPAPPVTTDAGRNAKEPPLDDASTPSLDPDGVLMVRPTRPGGTSWRLGTADPNTAPDFAIERGTKATPGTDPRAGGVGFYNLASYAFKYASGPDGRTSRFHIYASHTKNQKATWKTQTGWLATPADLKDQEFTVYARAHGVVDPPRAAFTLKIRGGSHNATDGDLASCTMMVFAGPATTGIARFGKELFHPQYDYVKLKPANDAQLENGVWVGLKLVSYQRAAEPSKVHYELWVDRTPFDAVTGKPSNTFTLFSEFIDVEGTSTGSYSKLADWGGMQTTFRVDGIANIDFALVSLREIVPL